MVKNQKGSAFSFAFGTSEDAIADSLNKHYAEKLRSPVGWYGTATVNVAADAKGGGSRTLKYARTACGWEVYGLVGTITDAVTVKTGKFQPIK
jgi:hypothetical protein